jgi:hypothetical protein
MAENKKSFLLYCDLIHVVKKLSDDQAGKLLKHILSYVNDENPIMEDVLLDLVFEPIKQNLKRDLQKYKETCNKNKENVLKRWNKKNTNEYDSIKKIRTNTNDTDNDTDNDNDNDIDNEKENINTTHTFNFKKSLIQYGFEKNLVEDWIKVRKNKKATNTQLAFNKFINEVEKSNYDKNEIMKIVIIKSWTSFNNSWNWREETENSNNNINQINTDELWKE